MNGYRMRLGKSGMTALAAGCVAALCSMAIATSVAAQTQIPLTSEQPPVAPQIQQQAQAPITTAAPPHHVTQVGDATLSILALQRSGQAASPAQPMLGAEAGAAYARYLKSFDHPIPEHMDSSVGAAGGATSGGASN
jgi:Protein of unknown function (DUF3613)